MWNKLSQTVITDMLFNLLLIFIALFYITFVMISIAKQEENDAKSDNNILITMRWNTNNDIDLWLKLPDERKVWYSNRDVPPAHLDVDVVAWRGYTTTMGETYVIENNEEIITIRDLLEGEYVINAHYFSAHNVDPQQMIDVEILVQDVQNKNVIYYGVKKMNMTQREMHFVRFTVEAISKTQYRIKRVYTDRPTFFVGDTRSQSEPLPHFLGE